VHAALQLSPTAPIHNLSFSHLLNAERVSYESSESYHQNLMAELSLAASIVGLVSLGIQISQGLNLYIDSASNARPRVQAIATDIELAIQVVKELQTTIEDPVSKALINDNAQRTAAQTISQFRRVFEQIKQKVPVPGQSGIRAYQRLKWPFTESKVNLLRAELENAKATLQLLMDVIIFAAMRKRYRDHSTSWRILLYANMTSYAPVSSLEQREQCIRESKSRQNQAIAAAKIAALEHNQSESRIRKQGSVDQYHSDGLYAESTSRGDQSRDSSQNDHLSDGQDSGHSETSSEYENLRVSLSGDYEICLGRLKAMQTTIEGALRKLSPTSARRSTAGARRRLIKKVDDNGRQTLLCLRRARTRKKCS